MSTSTAFQKVIDAIDTINGQDPNQEEVNGQAYPKELLYSQRMTDKLLEFEPEASELLQIAARGQHIKRWSIPRESYSMDRKGYLKWRTVLKMKHGEIVGDLMTCTHYPKEDIQHVKDLLMKKNLNKDPEAQTLEDVICLVFLEHYIDDFAAEHTDEKMISILQKTWGKMSEKGHEAALKLPLSEKVKELVGKALA
ncbi:DUF4202 domain-containing protein [Marinoscillum furvescens]|uniref:Uncharacterized protein DUF4202 n=1 Tax=Marinoscillum furvescens DSM 4134 TaxID=1122208 RepID=A0A3D9L7T5_MARFU|nr:DUF4202 domain-containing protein [Marinoscillum furvescens]REE02142.1 uncharacterized protein DUF4202 [Marinoscillum furvescens DSM 4134]